jgi:hypothetical protein
MQNAIKLENISILITSRSSSYQCRKTTVNMKVSGFKKQLCLYAQRSCMLFVIGEDDDATACAFSRGCCEVNGTAVKSVSGGSPH